MPNPTRTERLRPTPGRILLALVAALTLLLTGGCRLMPQLPHQHVNTLFGSNVWQAPGETESDAMARVDSTYGPIAIARVFSAWMPPSWPSLRHDIGDRPIIVSFRLRPAKVLAGQFDDELTAWFRQAPTDQDTYWVYYHEPEDEIERGLFTAEQFKAAWTHIAQLADSVHNRRLHNTLILMCWTAGAQSGRDWHDYVPDDGSVDVLAWDCYAKGDDASTYADTEALLEPARAASASIGAYWGIGELGARIIQGDDGHARAAWLKEVGDYAIEHDALFVAYFDAPIGGDFRLTDRPSIDAWKRLIER
jgi:hypothetical protein